MFNERLRIALDKRRIYTDTCKGLYASTIISGFSFQWAYIQSNFLLDYFV